MPLNKCNCPSTYGATALSDLASVKRSLHSLSIVYIGAVETLFFLMYQSQYTTFTNNQYQNTGYVHAPLGTTSINAYIHNTGLAVCFANWQVSCLETSQTLKKATPWEPQVITVVTFLM